MLTTSDILSGAPLDLDLDAGGAPRRPVVVVDLTATHVQNEAHVGEQLAEALPVVIGVGPLRSPELADGCDLVLTADGGPSQRWEVPVPDVAAAVQDLVARIADQPRAAVSLAAVLRQTELLDVRSGLGAESAAYSALLAGPDFAAWLTGRQRPSGRAGIGRNAVTLARAGQTLRVRLERPDKRNAIDAAVRESLLDAFAVARADPSLRVEWTGDGPSFSAGGDLAEFGTAPDPATAHLVRLDRSLGWAAHCLADRLWVRLHGACRGAGVEVPAFAGHVSAHPAASLGLPELAMGLIPGAGGTVSVPRRIGRWRTAWMVLSGMPLDAATALDWGLVDVVET